MPSHHEANSASNSPKISRWQRERAQRLHRQFISVDKAVTAGATLKSALNLFLRYWRDRPYQCDRTRKAKFGFATLVRAYSRWCKGGRNPASLALNYKGLAPTVPADLMMRFVEFSSVHKFRNLKAAWAEFTRRRGWIGRGRQSTNPVKVTYGMVQYYFSGKKFARLQSAQRTIARGEDHLAALRLEYMGEIHARLPQNPRRRRTGQELSMEGACL